MSDMERAIGSKIQTRVVKGERFQPLTPTAIEEERIEASRFAAVATLESLGYTYSGGSWVAPLSDNQRARDPYPGIVKIGNTVFPPGVSLEAAEQYMRDKLQASEGGSTDE